LSKDEVKISVAICTYNRAFYLDKCLASIYQYLKADYPVEILIIDNNSTDDTREVVDSYLKKYDNLYYYIEKQPGLSYGRNRAITEANAEIIAYLDDDVLISNTYFERLLWVIDNYEFDCLGGMYFPWYPNEKPKWLPDTFGQKEKLLDSIGELKEDYVTGLNMVFTKSILNEIGGFPGGLGMKGEKIGYGEEDFVQYQIRKKGGTIIFDPDLYVYHAVLEYKQHISWQLKSIFINSQTNFIIHNNDEKLFDLVFTFFKSVFAGIFKRLPLGIFKLIADKDFFYQNLILYILKPILKSAGNLKVFFQKNRTLI